MNVSGIVVTAARGRMQEVSAAVAALPGIDVHYHDPGSGRIVVTQEAPDVGAEVEGLRRIKAVPGVIYAEMVYHGFEDDPRSAAEWQAGLEALDAEGDTVPSSLRD